MITSSLIALFSITSIISVFLTNWLCNFLKRKNIFDMPNERSNHTIPTPVGGGIIVMLMIIVSYTILLFITDSKDFVLHNILILAAILSLISLVDDIKKLPASYRLIAQVIASIIAISLIPDNLKIFPIIPDIVEKVFLIICLIWFTNLYNFMDGIDGMTSAETIHIALSFVIISLIIHPGNNELFYMAIIVIASMTGFIIFNLHPAKIFLGDVGSIPLGFIVGWILIYIAKFGYLYFSLIVPLYYIFDATYTIIRRLLAGKNIFRAHSEHFFQKAVRNGKKHSDVVRIVLVINILLTILSIISTTYGIISLLLGVIIVLLGIYYLICQKVTLRKNSA